MSQLIYKDESYQMIGAGMEVYNQLGCGFLEGMIFSAETVHPRTARTFRHSGLHDAGAHRGQGCATKTRKDSLQKKSYSFLKAVYHEAVAIEFGYWNSVFSRQSTEWICEIRGQKL